MGGYGIMELKDIKHAILHQQKIKCGDLTGIPFGCIMRLAQNGSTFYDVSKIKISPDTKLYWQYLVEYMDKNNRTVYIGKLEDCHIVDDDVSANEK